MIRLASLLVVALIITGTLPSRIQAAETIHADMGNAHWGPASGNFEIAAAVGSAFTAGSAMPVDVSIKNRGNAAVTIERLHGFADYHVEISDARGNRVTGASEKHFSYYAGPSWSRILTLQPGQVQTELLDLNEFYDLVPGVYTLTVSRPVYAEESTKLLATPTSSTVSFTVS